MVDPSDGRRDGMERVGLLLRRLGRTGTVLGM
jgi:hypothetical protein